MAMDIEDPNKDWTSHPLGRPKMKSAVTSVSSPVGCQAGVDGAGSSPATQCLSSDL